MGNTGEVKKLLEGVADVNEPNDVSRIVITPRTCIRGKVVGLYVCCPASARKLPNLEI